MFLIFVGSVFAFSNILSPLILASRNRPFIRLSIISGYSIASSQNRAGALYPTKMSPAIKSEPLNHFHLSLICASNHIRNTFSCCVLLFIVVRSSLPKSCIACIRLQILRRLWIMPSHLDILFYRFSLFVFYLCFFNLDLSYIIIPPLFYLCSVFLVQHCLCFFVNRFLLYPLICLIKRIYCFGFFILRQ